MPAKNEHIYIYIYICTRLNKWVQIFAFSHTSYYCRKIQNTYKFYIRCYFFLFALFSFSFYPFLSLTLYLSRSFSCIYYWCCCCCSIVLFLFVSFLPVPFLIVISYLCSRHSRPPRFCVRHNVFACPCALYEVYFHVVSSLKL